MDEAKAREILKEAITEDGGLNSLAWCLDWETEDSTACLSGPYFTDDLEEIAWWIEFSEGGGK